MPATVEESPPIEGGGSRDDSSETVFSSRGCCFCFQFPSRRTNWERIEKEQERSDGGRWSGVVKVLKKVREWSELAAGPKWKTFIRRFNRTDGRSKIGKFQYDPSSYALNFDERKISDQIEDDRIFRDFSSRYAAVSVQNILLKESTSFGENRG